MNENKPCAESDHEFEFWRYASETEKELLGYGQSSLDVELKRCTKCATIAHDADTWDPIDGGDQPMISTITGERVPISKTGTAKLLGELPLTCPCCDSRLPEFDSSDTATCDKCKTKVEFVHAPFMMHWRPFGTPYDPRVASARWTTLKEKQS